MMTTVFLPDPAWDIERQKEFTWSDLEALGIRRTGRNVKPENWYTAAHEVALPNGWRVIGESHVYMNNTFDLSGNLKSRKLVRQFFPRSLVDKRGYWRVGVRLKTKVFDKGRYEPICVLNGSWHILP